MSLVAEAIQNVDEAIQKVVEAVQNEVDAIQYVVGAIQIVNGAIQGKANAILALDKFFDFTISFDNDIAEQQYRNNVPIGHVEYFSM